MKGEELQEPRLWQRLGECEQRFGDSKWLELEIENGLKGPALVGDADEPAKYHAVVELASTSLVYSK